MWYVLGLIAVIWYCVHSYKKEGREYQQKLKAWQDVDRIAKECGVVNPLPEPQRRGYEEPHGSVGWGM